MVAEGKPKCQALVASARTYINLNNVAEAEKDLARAEVLDQEYGGAHHEKHNIENRKE
jgi:hypothetical protein